jgi:hypothetical protein
MFALKSSLLNREYVLINALKALVSIVFICSPQVIFLSNITPRYFTLCSWSSSCGRQSVDQFVWVSGLPLGPLTRFHLALLSSSDNYFILLWKAPSLTRKRVCSYSAITH